VQAGYGFGRTDWEEIPGTLGHFVADGWLGGGQVGANVQAGLFVAGVEAEWLWSGVRGEEGLSLGGVTANDTTRINWLATVTGRVGVAPWNGALLYGKAGAAIAEIDHERRIDVAGSSITISGRHLNPGYVFGAGLEQMLPGNWSARLEYAYVSFLERTQVLDGSQTLPGGTVVGIVPQELKQSLQLVKLGINYRFAPPPP
jgi:opacity protein-like surface antigen